MTTESKALVATPSATPAVQQPDRFYDPKVEALKAQAEVLIKGGLLPTALQGKPAAVMTTMLYGAELGISPIRAVNSIHVIEGRPSISANLMLTLVRERIPSFQLEVMEAGPTISKVRHRRSREDDWQVASYTIEEAKLAGLTGKAIYQKHPAEMLFARNTSRLCRWGYSDVLAGMVHTPEELEEAALRDVTAKLAGPKADPIKPVENDSVNEDAVMDLVATFTTLKTEQELSKAHDAFAEAHKASPATVAEAFDAYQNALKRIGGAA